MNIPIIIKHSNINKLRHVKIIDFVYELYKNKILYLMTVPAVLFFFIFNYIPIAGIVVAFKNFKYKEGIFLSPWIDPIFKNFEFFFTSGNAWRVTRNTLLLNACFIIIGVIVQVTLSLLLNEINNGLFKRVTQSFTLMPHFVSWIVVGVITYNLFQGDHGVINSALHSIGFKEIDWYTRGNLWPIIMVFLNTWKTMGIGIVFYTAALSSVDVSYYEAAEIDGATKLQQIKYISIPFLIPTIFVLLLMAVGKIMNADFGMFYAVVGENPNLYPTVDVIDTFVFRSLRVNSDIGMSSAVGLYQSCVSFILVLLSNSLVKKYREDSALF